VKKYLAVTLYAWGIGDSAASAKRKARSLGSSVPPGKQIDVFEFEGGFSAGGLSCGFEQPETVKRIAGRGDFLKFGKESE
jgi:hypothetical protein